MIKKLLLASFVLPLALSSLAQQPDWYSIEKAVQSKTTKLYMVDFYTTWCGWCKRMDKETFSDPLVSKILDTYYIPVKFNAEGNSVFTWKGMKYSGTPTPPGGRPTAHAFAKAVLGQKMGFPSFAIFAADQSLLTILQGFQSADDFVMVLWYFASGDYKKYSFDKYQAIFSKDIRPDMLKALNVQ